MVVWLDPNSPDDFRCHSFAGDDWRECRDYVRVRLRLAEWQPSVTNAPALRHLPNIRRADLQREDDRQRTEWAMTLWNEAESPRGTLVEHYLCHRRLSLRVDVLSADVLRFHPCCPFRLEDEATMRLPAMLALMRDISTNEPRAIHRTALKDDGTGKSNLPGLGNAKKMLGPSKNAMVKLTADDVVIEGLGIAEGIETALTLICANWRPVWACGAAGAIERFPVLPGIECLTVFADADRAGMAAGVACQARWVNAGLECRILAPPEAGADWNDVMRTA
jgi:hypothetical protein